MGSPNVVDGRGVGSRAALVALRREQELSRKWENMIPCRAGEIKKLSAGTPQRSWRNLGASKAEEDATGHASGSGVLAEPRVPEVLEDVRGCLRD